jgi:hypothetical protein
MKERVHSGARGRFVLPGVAPGSLGRCSRIPRTIGDRDASIIGLPLVAGSEGS